MSDVVAAMVPVAEKRLRAPSWWERWTVADFWSYFSKIPIVGRWMFSVLFSFVVPFSSVIKPRFRTITATSSESRVSIILPDLGRNRNHLGSIHAGALFTAGELATAMAATLAGQMLTKSLGGRIGVLPTAAKIGYLKKARGGIGVECIVEHSVLQKAIEAGDGEVWVNATLRDNEGTGVDVATFELKCNLRKA